MQPSGPAEPTPHEPTGAGASAVPPKRSRKAVVATFALAAIAMLVGAVVTSYFFLRPDTPTQVVNDYFAAFSAHDVDGMRDMICAQRLDDSSDQWLRYYGDLSDATVTIRFTESHESITGDTAIVEGTLRVERSDNPPRETAGAKVVLIMEHGDWKICTP